MKRDCITTLVDALKAIRGEKILTLSTERLELLVIDMHDDGTFGYNLVHRARVMGYFHEMLAQGGGMIIRRFTPFTSGTAKDKHDRPLPVKQLYGVSFGNNTWWGISKEALRDACTHDAVTGKAIPNEPAVIYCDFQHASGDPGKLDSGA